MMTCSIDIAILTVPYSMTLNDAKPRFSDFKVTSLFNDEYLRSGIKTIYNTELLIRTYAVLKNVI